MKQKLAQAQSEDARVKKKQLEKKSAKAYDCAKKANEANRKRRKSWRRRRGGGSRLREKRSGETANVKRAEAEKLHVPKELVQLREEFQRFDTAGAGRAKLRCANDPAKLEGGNLRQAPLV